MLSSIFRPSHLRGTVKMRLPSPKIQYNVNGIDQNVLEAMAVNIMQLMDKKNIDLSIKTASDILKSKNSAEMFGMLVRKSLNGGKSLRGRFRNKTMKKIRGGNKGSFFVFILTIIICLMFFIRPNMGSNSSLTQQDIDIVLKSTSLLDKNFKFKENQNIIPDIVSFKSKSKSKEVYPIADIIEFKHIPQIVIINNDFLTGITRTDTPEFEKLIIKIDETIREIINSPDINENSDSKIETILKTFSMSEENRPNWKDGFNYFISLKPNPIANPTFSMDEALDKLVQLDFKFAKATGFGDKIHKIEYLKTLLISKAQEFSKPSNQQNLIDSSQSQSSQTEISAQSLFDAAIFITRDNIAIGILDEAKKNSLLQINNASDSDSEFMQKVYTFIKSISVIMMFIGSAALYKYKNNPVFEDSVVHKLKTKEEIISDWREKSKKIQADAAAEEKKKENDFYNIGGPKSTTDTKLVTGLSLAKGRSQSRGRRQSPGRRFGL